MNQDFSFNAICNTSVSYAGSFIQSADHDLLDKCRKHLLKQQPVKKTLVKRIDMRIRQLFGEKNAG